MYDVLQEVEKVYTVATAMVRGSEKPIGLVNPRNTCYLNVLLHCLYASLPFRHFLYISIVDCNK